MFGDLLPGGHIETLANTELSFWIPAGAFIPCHHCPAHLPHSVHSTPPTPLRLSHSAIPLRVSHHRVRLCVTHFPCSGQERFGNMTRVYYKLANAALIVFDLTKPNTFDAVRKWKEDLDDKVRAFVADQFPHPLCPLPNPIPTTAITTTHPATRLRPIVMADRYTGACSCLVVGSPCGSHSRAGGSI